MIECNGSHVITLNHKHGNAVYRCTLANARRLLDECLQTDAHDLATAEKERASDPRAVRPVTWLTRALAEVRDQKEAAPRLRTVLYGPGPRERDAVDSRPNPVVTKEMQAELVMLYFNSKLKLEALDGNAPVTVAQLTAGWGTLSFLEVARQRLPDVAFIEDYLYDGLEQLSILRRNSWKETAREETIIGNHFVPFLNEWGSGRWNVEPVIDA